MTSKAYPVNLYGISYLTCPCTHVSTMVHAWYAFKARAVSRYLCKAKENVRCQGCAAVFYTINRKTYCTSSMASKKMNAKKQKFSFSLSKGGRKCCLLISTIQ